MTGTRRAPSVRTPLVQAAVVVVAFVLAGAVAGVVWHQWWDPPTGVVTEGRWFPAPYEESQRADFGGTATYVVVAVAAGAVLGLLSSLFLASSEVVALAAVAVGSALAGLVMAGVGSALGPADPDTVAPSAREGTELPGELAVVGVSPYAAFPIGALLALTGVYLARPGPERVPPKR